MNIIGKIGYGLKIYWESFSTVPVV